MKMDCFHLPARLLQVPSMKDQASTTAIWPAAIVVTSPLGLPHFGPEATHRVRHWIG